MYNTSRTNIGRRAMVIDTASHHFEMLQVIRIVGIDREFYECKADDGLEQVLTPNQVEIVEEPAKQVDETSSHRLVLTKAEFHDSKGRKHTVKRSNCRHYYLKVEGQNQKRVSLASIKGVVANV